MYKLFPIVHYSANLLCIIKIFYCALFRCFGVHKLDILQPGALISCLVTPKAIHCCYAMWMMLRNIYAGNATRYDNNTSAGMPNSL